MKLLCLLGRHRWQDLKVPPPEDLELEEGEVLPDQMRRCRRCGVVEMRGKLEPGQSMVVVRPPAEDSAARDYIAKREAHERESKP